MIKSTRKKGSISNNKKHSENGGNHFVVHIYYNAIGVMYIPDPVDTTPTCTSDEVSKGPPESPTNSKTTEGA
jgi:hypothetical protein